MPLQTSYAIKDRLVGSPALPRTGGSGADLLGDVTHRDRDNPLSGAHREEGPLVLGKAGITGTETVPCLGDYLAKRHPAAICSAIHRGLQATVTVPPMLDPGRALTGISRTPQEFTAMDEEVESLLMKGAIEQVHGQTQGLFLLPFSTL